MKACRKVWLCGVLAGNALLGRLERGSGGVRRGARVAAGDGHASGEGCLDSVGGALLKVKEPAAAAEGIDRVCASTRKRPTRRWPAR